MIKNAACLIALTAVATTTALPGYAPTGLDLVVKDSEFSVTVDGTEWFSGNEIWYWSEGKKLSTKVNYAKKQTSSIVVSESSMGL